MNRRSRRRDNARLILAGLGLAVFYGSLTSFILQLCGSEEAVKIGGIVTGATALLALIAAVSIIWLFGPEDRSFVRPTTIRQILALILCCLAFAVLILPLVILTAGRAWRWLLG